MRAITQTRGAAPGPSHVDRSSGATYRTPLEATFSWVRIGEYLRTDPTSK